MDKLLPCPHCGNADAPSVHTLRIGHRGGHSFGWCDTNYGGCGARGAVALTEDAAAAAWNRRAPAATDPALLALARLGAMVLDWSPLECGFPTIPGGVIDEMAVRSGCALEDASDGGHECWTAPGVRLAIAALLAPDGADVAGEVTRECKCRLRTRLVGDGCDVCNPELAAEHARQREVADGD